MTTPDDKMGEPIDKVLFWAARLTDRTLKIAEMSRRERDCVKPTFLTTEDDLRHAYRVVLKARAEEVVEYCNKCGQDIDVDEVREWPFAVALAIGTLLGYVEGY